LYLYFFVISTVFLIIIFFYLIGCKFGLVGTCTFILNYMILYENKITIPIVIADPGIFIRIIRSYLCTVNSIVGIAT